MLPQLRKLEERFPDELVIVGVEAGKYPAERDTANIRQAVLRLGVRHPVVNDRHFRIWRSYAVSAWPTLVLVDPAGYYLGSHPGEITFADFAPIVERHLGDREGRGVLDRQSLPWLHAELQPDRPLAFPGKVLAAGSRLFVADTGHHRLVIVSLDRDGAAGEVVDLVGSGTPGLQDGSFERAAFSAPQGLALAGDVLYVADSESHAIRAVDLMRREVSTVAGTGEQGRGATHGGPARTASLSSPWDLALADGDLYIAMAGTHQIWRLDLKRGEVDPYAGSGREDLHDGERSSAALAQPMGICAGGQRLFFADSESSAVRWVELPPGKSVGTVVGTGLFDYGDQDGAADAVRLQHAQAVAFDGRVLYVADTYNNRIKRVDPTSRVVTAVFGDGQPGDSDGAQARFDEPGGLSLAGDRLYIADTNNHAIRFADLTAGTVATVRLRT